jgi:hypothetical protein
MHTKLEIGRQAELFPSSGFFQPRKVVLLSSFFRIARLLSIVVTLKPGGRQLSNRIRDALRSAL